MSFNEERAQAVFYELIAAFLIKKRKINDALRYVDEGILFLGKTGLEMINIALLGMKCQNTGHSKRDRCRRRNNRSSNQPVAQKKICSTLL